MLHYFLVYFTIVVMAIRSRKWFSVAEAIDIFADQDSGDDDIDGYDDSNYICESQPRGRVIGQRGAREVGLLHNPEEEF
jgi:hypothetical protein